jgi:hypothetical protein
MRLGVFHRRVQANFFIFSLFDPRLSQDEKSHHSFEFVSRSPFKIEFAVFARRIEERVFHLRADMFVEMFLEKIVDRVSVVLTVALDLFQIQLVLEEFVPRFFLDDADPVGAEDGFEAIGAEADGRRQVRDIAIDEADPIDQRDAGAVFDPGDDSMTVELELDLRVNL